MEFVDDSHLRLLGSPDLWPVPWTRDGIETLQIGATPKGQWIYPVFDIENRLINEIRHKSGQWKGARSTLYPANLIRDYDRSYIVICEGLKDCVSLHSARINAATSTNGLSIPKDLELLKSFKKIFLCFDYDKTGESGVQKWINRLMREVPEAKIRVCDLSDFVEISGDVSDYLEQPKHNGETFISDILDTARVGRLFSDVPDFVRNHVLEGEFYHLKANAQLVMYYLSNRVSRYYIWITEKNGQRIQVRLNPGEIVRSYSLIAQDCHISPKQARNAIGHLEAAALISKADTHSTLGLKITILGWSQAIGQAPRHGKATISGRGKYPYFKLAKTVSKVEGGQG
ncbi:toprim domain-containing protein [Candidatus Neomarinimicrobiota bacterium]